MADIEREPFTDAFGLYLLFNQYHTNEVSGSAGVSTTVKQKCCDCPLGLVGIWLPLCVFFFFFTCSVWWSSGSTDCLLYAKINPFQIFRVFQMYLLYAKETHCKTCI